MGGLIAIAAIPALVGFSPDADQQALFAACRAGLLWCAALCLLGAAVAALGYARDTGKVAAPS